MWCSPLSDAQLFTLPLHLLCLLHQQGSLSFAVESTNSYFCYLGIATGKTISYMQTGFLYAITLCILKCIYCQFIIILIAMFATCPTMSFYQIYTIYLSCHLWDFLLSGFLGMLYIPDLQCPHFLSTHINNTGLTSSPQLLTCCTQLYNRWNNMFDPGLFRASVLSISHLAAVIFLSLL